MAAELGLFDGVYAHGAAAIALSDTAWLQAMLDFEAALARAHAAEGTLPAAEAERIVAVCDAGRYDLSALSREGARHAQPVVGLIAAMRAQLAPAEDRVHLGATSQDTVDTAAMLVARRALVPLLADADAAARAAAGLAREHAGTPQPARTLLQQALPTSFGLVAAGWADGVAAARARLLAIAETELAVQMGGPVGSAGLALSARMAAELGLAEPALPWHTIRVRPAALAGALGTLAGVLGKVARDITLLAQSEVGEVSEGGGPGAGASSAMAHKRNPTAALSVLACTRRVPGLVATMLAAMEQEHQRAAGAWQAEWGTLTELLGLTASAAAWARELLGSLQIHPSQMAANLERMAAAQVREAADPSGHLGDAAAMIDRALAEYEL